MEEQQPKKILEMAQIAKKLGISAATCRNWCVIGRIPAFRYYPKGRWRAFEEDIDRYLDEHRSSNSTGQVEGASQ